MPTGYRSGLARRELINGIDHERITSLCLEIWPDVIVNCAAISSSAQVHANPTLAEQINVACQGCLHS